jgi:hypothetical protein
MKFLHELVESVYENPDVSNHELKRLFEDQNSSGYFWEKCLAKHMKHTSLCEKRNEPGRDFLDGTDAKFAMAGRYTNSFSRQATIGIENKIGTLRVCLCYKGDQYHKVFFMRIPHEAYKDLQGENIKITFSRKNLFPMGKFWEKYQCSWEEVIAPDIDNNA